MKIERTISFFDLKTGKFQGEFEVTKKISKEQLLSIFKPYPEDPDLYMVYDINEIEAAALKERIDFEFSFDKFKYQLDCFQIE